MNPPRLRDRYRLDHRIGAGGMGEVWRATDELLGRVVAVKTVRPDLCDDEDFTSRFRAEARAMAGVRHHGVVVIHDFHHGRDGAFLVMEYVEGQSLASYLERAGRLAPDAALHVVGQAADALHAVHRHGIVHRDVKPANLLLRPDGSVLLTDFGIARRDGATAMTATGVVIGTMSYLAPEQVLGHPATILSDVYALGLVAYECLSGRRPFVAENPFGAAMMRVSTPPPPLGPAVPPDVAALVARALAVDPADRWPSAAAFGAAIAAARSRPPAPPTEISARLAVPSPAGTIPVATGSESWTGSAPVAAGPGAWTGSAPSWTGSPRPPTTDRPPAPLGFRAWGELYLPAEPLCWGGLVIPGGLGRTPRRIPPHEPHYWETFAAAELPEDAIYLRQEELLGHPAVAAACSARVLAASSRDPARTSGWEIEPWPVQLGRDRWILHCLAAPGTGEWLGSEFGGH